MSDSENDLTDFTKPNFDPQLLNISALIKLLATYDVDLPNKREKKQVYVDLCLEHLAYMRKRHSDELKLSTKKQPKGFLSPRARNSPRRKGDLQTEESKENLAKDIFKDKDTPLKKSEDKTATNSPVASTPRKKRAVNLEDSLVFSDDNPFQSPKIRLDKDALDIEFSKTVPKFSESPKTLTAIINEKTSPAIKKTIKKSPRKTIRSVVDDYEIKELPAKDLPVTPLKMPANSSKSKLEIIQQKLQKRKRPTKIWPVLYLLPVFLAFFVHWAIVDYPSLKYCSAADHPRVYKFISGCISCPSNSICEGRNILGCTSNDYKLKETFLSRFLPNKIIPFPFDQPTCTLDSSKILLESKKKRQIEHLIQVLDSITREYVGGVTCGNTVKPEHKFIISRKKKVLGIPASLAKQEMKKLVGSRWDDATFEDYWGLVLNRLMTEDTPVRSIVDEFTSQNRIFSSANPPILTTSCKIKISIWNFVVQYSVQLLSIALLLGISLISYSMYQSGVYEGRVVAYLVQDVLSAIHAEYDLYHSNSQKHPIPGLSVTQLCDHFLPRTVSDLENEHDSAGRLIWYLDEGARKRVWKKVAKEVCKNSNIRETSAQLKGEAHTCWIWIGSSALSPVKKRVRTDVGDVGVAAIPVSK
ncbi:inner nuclear membrane protein enriched at telomere/subtelomere region [Boothiomyces macroporosus]|uniref:Inner nuclear membrane protein enriched at telomere/subtelomere region n=1 Tax=Boothiomyces macroporosus TaxID=261099 RepID=A0AAD5UN41_9FUNG|nr:inner nuclear membrane protein enriched at telomere/subtelomere region [Boothiomyces macroporosus]